MLGKVYNNAGMAGTCGGGGGESSIKEAQMFKCKYWIPVRCRENSLYSRILAWTEITEILSPFHPRVTLTHHSLVALERTGPPSPLRDGGPLFGNRAEGNGGRLDGVLINTRS